MKLQPTDLASHGAYYLRTPKDNGVDIYLGSGWENSLRGQIRETCRHAMSQTCQEGLMAFLGTTGAHLEKRILPLLFALAIVEIPIVFVVIVSMFHNYIQNIPQTTNLHLPGSNLNGASQAMTASTFVVKVPKYQQLDGKWTTESTVTRTLTTATTDHTAPLVTQYPGQADVVLILTNDMAVELQRVIENSAYPTCAQLQNFKRQAFPGGAEYCGFAGAAGAAQPGLALENLLVLRNPLDFHLDFRGEDVVQIFAAAMAMMHGMIGAPDDLLYRAELSAPWIFMLVYSWVRYKQRVGTINTVSREWLNSVTTTPKPTRTSTTSSSSSTSSKKPCRTDVLEVDHSVSVVFFVLFAPPRLRDQARLCRW